MLDIQASTYQNVIGSMDLSDISEKALYSESEEQRLKVEISSLFGAAIHLTCASGKFSVWS